LFTFWCDFTDEDITRTDERTDTDDTVFIEITEFRRGNIWDIVGRALRSELCFTDIECVFVDRNMGKHVILDETRIDDNRIFKVVPIPWHVGYSEIVSESEFTVFHSVSIDEDIPREEFLTMTDTRILVELHVVI
jgi:hypothetical protein